MTGRREVMDAAVAQARAELPEPIAYDTHQCAAATGLSRKWLEHARTSGGGPPFVRIGRHVRYLRSDVEAWLAAHRVASTAEEVGR